jgi:lysozyme
MHLKKILAATALAVAPALAAEAALPKPAVHQYPAYSGNYSHTPIATRTGIVIHKMEGASAEVWFANPAAGDSVNYSVERDATIFQSVPDDFEAWHCGNSAYNISHLGIEHAGYTAQNDTTESMYRASARLSAWMCSKWHIPVDRQHLIGHVEVPDPFHPGEFGGADHHTDPGHYWNWPHYIALVKSFLAGQSAPPATKPTPAPVKPTPAPAPVKPAPTPAKPAPAPSGVRRVVRHNGTRARGIDVSEFQGTIDWAQVKSAGMSFAIARVSDGLGHQDPTFERNWSEMKAHGLVRGVYQFFRPEENATQQADALVAKVGKLEAGDLPPVLDVEVTDGVSGSRIGDQIATWAAEIRKKTGLTPMVYTAPGFWNGLGVTASKDTLWVADWGVSTPTAPRGWSDWEFWQFADDTHVAGIGGAVDGDEFHGTVDDLKAFVGLPGASTGGTVVTTTTTTTTTPPSTTGKTGSLPTTTVLTEGNSGPAVVTLQLALERHGENPGATDGVFGPNTLAAVRAFQTKSHITVDGVVGPHTWAALAQ